MAIALFTLGGLLAPLRSLRDRLLRTPKARRRMPAGPQAAQSPGIRSSCPVSGGIGGRRPTLARPVRVVRLVEAAPVPAGAGRMFISGRMADVCAELDRLAALETAAG